MISFWDKNKRIIRIVVIGLSVSYIIFTALILLNGSFREFVINVAESLMGRGLDHDHWNRWFFGYRFIFVSCFCIICAWFFITDPGIKFLSFMKKCVIEIGVEAKDSYIIYLIGITLAFCLFLNGFWASDFYPNYQYQSYSFYVPQIGGELLVFDRPLTHLVFNINPILNIWGINVYNSRWLSEITGMMLFALCAALLEKSLLRIIKQEVNIWILRVCVFICFVNPFIVEAYCFTPFDFAIGILCDVLFVCLIIRKRWIMASFMAFIAEGFYESNITIIIVLSVTAIFILNVDKNVLMVINEEIKGIFSAFVGAGSYMVLYKAEIMIFGTMYDGKDIKFMAGQKSVFDYFMYFAELVSGMYIKPHGYMPEYSVALYLIVIFLIVFLFLVIRKEYRKTLIYSLFYFVCIICPFIYCIATVYGSYARLLFSYFFAIGMVSLVSYIMLSSDVRVRSVVGSFVVTFFMLVVFMTQTFIADTFIGQALSWNIAHMVEDRIEEYEEYTGLEVKTIVVRGCDSIRDFYEEQLVNREFTYAHPVIYDKWAQGEFLNFVNKTDYDHREMTLDEYEKYFHKKDFDSFNLKDQMVFVGSTAYWVIY